MVRGAAVREAAAREAATRETVFGGVREEIREEEILGKTLGVVLRKAEGTLELRRRGAEAAVLQARTLRELTIRVGRFEKST